MSVRLVSGGLGDLDALALVTSEAFDPRFGEAWSAAQLRGTLAQPGSWLRIAVDSATAEGGGAIGFTLCRLLVDEAELLLIAVVPGARGTGVGRLLLEAALEDARGRGVTSMFLEMRDGNAAGGALYRGRGFVEVGRRRDYYRGAEAQRFDAITMRRTLNT